MIWQFVNINYEQLNIILSIIAESRGRLFAQFGLRASNFSVGELREWFSRNSKTKL